MNGTQEAITFIIQLMALVGVGLSVGVLAIGVFCLVDHLSGGEFMAERRAMHEKYNNNNNQQRPSTAKKAITKP